MPLVSFVALTPSGARSFVRTSVKGFAPDVVDDAALLVSELVTLAVLQAHARHARVSVACDGLCAHVEVSVPTGATPSQPDFTGSTDDLDWLGLKIVDAIAPRWGTTEDRAGVGVWFELEDHEHAPAATDVRDRAAHAAVV